MVLLLHQASFDFKIGSIVKTDPMSHVDGRCVERDVNYKLLDFKSAKIARYHKPPMTQRTFLD